MSSARFPHSNIPEHTYEVICDALRPYHVDATQHGDLRDYVTTVTASAFVCSSIVNDREDTLMVECTVFEVDWDNTEGVVYSHSPRVKLCELSYTRSEHFFVPREVFDRVFIAAMLSQGAP